MPRKRSIQLRRSGRTRLLVGGMREPLRDYRRLNFTGFLRGAPANHVVVFLDLARVNVVNLLVGVILTDPLRRAVVHTSLFESAAGFANGQTGGRFIHSYNSTFPPRLLGRLSLG